MRIEKVKSAREVFNLMQGLDGDSFVASITVRSFSRQALEQMFHAKIVARWAAQGGVMFKNSHGHEAICNPHNEIGARLIRMRRSRARRAETHNVIESSAK